MRFERAIASAAMLSAGVLLASLNAGCTVQREVEYRTISTAGGPCPCCAQMANAILSPAATTQKLAMSPADVAVDTHLLESGQLHFVDVSNASMEAFLRDLNRRKDYAILCREGAASGESEYLWLWLTRVCDELRQRGYQFDDQGKLFFGSRAVALR